MAEVIATKLGGVKPPWRGQPELGKKNLASAKHGKATVYAIDQSKMSAFSIAGLNDLVHSNLFIDQFIPV